MVRFQRPHKSLTGQNNSWNDRNWLKWVAPKSVTICYCRNWFSPLGSLKFPSGFTCISAPAPKYKCLHPHDLLAVPALCRLCVGCSVGFTAFLRLPEDVALQVITLLLFVLSLKPHGLLFLLRLLTQTIHQPLLPQGFLLSIKHTTTQAPQYLELYSFCHKGVYDIVTTAVFQTLSFPTRDARYEENN